MPTFRVEVVCQNEKKDVAGVQTAGPLDARTIQSGAVAVDGTRFPKPTAIVDGDTMLCARCKGRLFFRLSDGSLHQAIPGALKVSG